MHERKGQVVLSQNHSTYICQKNTMFEPATTNLSTVPTLPCLSLSITTRDVLPEELGCLRAGGGEGSPTWQGGRIGWMGGGKGHGQSSSKSMQALHRIMLNERKKWRARHMCGVVSMPYGHAMHGGRNEDVGVLGVVAGKLLPPQSMEGNQHHVSHPPLLACHVYMSQCQCHAEQVVPTHGKCLGPPKPCSPHFKKHVMKVVCSMQ